MHITQPADPLGKIRLEQIKAAVTNPNSALPETVRALRSLRELDPRRYAARKTELPYVAVGIYHPPLRRKENFAFSEHLILDADHLAQNGLNPEELKASLAADKRVALMFTSPSADGLKIFFTLARRIHDPAYYSQFYRRFAAHFAAGCGLSHVLDMKTHDVSRACFLSYDPKAYFNPAHVPVDPEDFLSPETDSAPGLFEQQALEELKKAEQEAKAKAREAAGSEPEPLPADVLNKIKSRLNPDFRPKVPRHVYEPPEIEAVMENLKEKLAQNGLTLLAANPIHYGKQLRVGMENLWAEVNLFYGKKGFTVVKTTKTGSTPELAELVSQTLYQILYGA
jgi:hypothetical protein